MSASPVCLRQSGRKKKIDSGYLRVDVPFTAEERLAFKRFLDSHGLKGGKRIRSLIVKALRAEGAAPGGTP